MKFALLALFAAVMMVAASAQGPPEGPPPPGPPPPGPPPTGLLGKFGLGIHGDNHKGFNGGQKAACGQTTAATTTTTRAAG